MQAKAIRDPNVAGRINILGVRVAYADGLNAPKAGLPDATGNASAPRYSCIVLIPQESQDVINEVQGVMWQLAVNKWADKAQVYWQSMAANHKLALRDGATKADQKGFLGNMFISVGAKPEAPPKLFSQYVNGQGQLIELSRPQNVIYRGCYVNIQIDFWAQDNNYGKRINAEVKLVQFAGEGESFGGGGAAADSSVFAQGAQQAPSGFSVPGAAPQMPGSPAGMMPGMPQPGAAMGAPAGYAQPMQQPQFQQPAAQVPAPQAGFAPSMPTPGPAFSGGGAPMGGFPQAPGNPGMPAGFAPQAPQQFMPQQAPMGAAPWAPPGV